MDDRNDDDASSGVDTAEWGPDLLGPDYRSRTIPLGDDPDGEGPIRATLVRHDASGARPRAALLFVHGLSDYFFQTHLAEFLDNHGVRTYALDLRKCGRSREPGQTPHYVSDLALYDAELDAALSVVEEENPDLPVLLAGHSTGGLVVALWLARRRDVGGLGPVCGLLLDSPWFQLDVPDRTRPLLDPVIGILGARRPFYRLPLPSSDVYGTSTHSSAGGDFDYDVELKPFGGVGVRAGWLRAIRRGQRALQKGLHLPLPVLLVRSTTSSLASRSPDPDSDVVLDVRPMSRFAPSVSDDVTDRPVAGARHDVFLSRADVLGAVFAAVEEWLDRVLTTTDPNADSQEGLP